jgi:hypothetical protein
MRRIVAAVRRALFLFRTCNGTCNRACNGHLQWLLTRSNIGSRGISRYGKEHVDRENRQRDRKSKRLASSAVILGERFVVAIGQERAGEFVQGIST